MTETCDPLVSLSENPTRFIKQRVSDISPNLDTDDDSFVKDNIKLKPALLTSIVVINLELQIIPFFKFS